MLLGFRENRYDCKWTSDLDFFNHLIKEMNKLDNMSKKIDVLANNKVSLQSLKDMLQDIFEGNCIECNIKTRDLIDDLAYYAYGSFNKLVGHPAIIYNYYKESRGIGENKHIGRMKFSG